MRWTIYQTIKHQYFDFLMLVGLRDRLRCPNCSAVGTYKPHGGWLECLNKDHRSGFIREVLRKYGAKEATNRRWLCKYCGYNLSTDGEHWCFPNSKTKVWSVGDEFSVKTPKQAVEEIPIGSKYPVWPWRG
jgi:hypothetical protein